jgi:hypothetical protein
MDSWIGVNLGSVMGMSWSLSVDPLCRGPQRRAADGPGRHP